MTVTRRQNYNFTNNYAHYTLRGSMSHPTLHLRHRVKGRNTIGDAWDPTVYVVSEQMEDTYVVVHERGHEKRAIICKYLRACVPETVNRRCRLGHESEITVPLYEGTITSHPSNRACKSRARKRGWGQLGARGPYSPC